MAQESDRSLDACARLIAEIPTAVALFDRDRRYVAASTAWAEAFALARTTLAGSHHDEVCRTGRAALEHVQRRALAGDSVDDCPVGPGGPLQQMDATFSARPHHGADGSIAGAVVALQAAATSVAGEVTARSAEWLPDPLTRLPQRREFASRLQDALAEPDPRRGGVLAIAVKIGNLRRINHLHGRGVGDQVLKIVAERLLAGTRSRPSDEGGGTGRTFIARLGAGAFGMICAPPANRPDAAERLAERLLRTVQSPIAIGERSLWLSASVGHVAISAAQADADDVLRDLDLALQQARTSGSGKVVGWAQSLTKAAARYDTLAEQLQQALANGEFLLHYQPILCFDDNSLVGVEALLRWNHPSEGLVPSAAFVPVLEETGLIAEIGCWVIREAVRQVGSWRTLYGRNIVEWVAINLSARQLDDPASLLATLRSIHAGKSPVHRLKLEIAETVLMRRPDATRAVVAELQGLGIGFAIDDFGTGAASLDTLRRRPVDTVKIDGAFVAQIGTADGEKLLCSLLEIADMSGATVIAEGVELPAQRDFLRQARCRYGQGYLLGEPMDGALLGVFALTHAVHPDGVQSDIKRSVTERLIRRGA